MPLRAATVPLTNRGRSQCHRLWGNRIMQLAVSVTFSPCTHRHDEEEEGGERKLGCQTFFPTNHAGTARWPCAKTTNPDPYLATYKIIHCILKSTRSGL